MQVNVKAEVFTNFDVYQHRRANASRRDAHDHALPLAAKTLCGVIGGDIAMLEAVPDRRLGSSCDAPRGVPREDRAADPVSELGHLV